MKEDILCIYHGDCADGFTAAWAVWRRFPEARFYAARHGDRAPDCRGKTVVMVDFSYPRAEILRIAEQAETVLILDHHKSAEDELVDLPDNVKAFFDRDRSGAMMAWEFFHPHEPAPKLVAHVQDRDLWRFQLDGTAAFSANLFSLPFKFSEWDRVAAMGSDEYQKFLAGGVAITRKHQKDIRSLLKASAYRTTVLGHDVPIVNAPYFMASDAGHMLCQGEPFAVTYWVRDDRACVFSLRSDDQGVDVSEIAVRFGGGGHQHAAGFTLSGDRLDDLAEGPKPYGDTME